MKEYALYKGDEFVFAGTIKEIAEKTGVKEKTIAHYRTAAYEKNLEKRKNGGKNANILVRLDDDLIDEEQD